MQLTLNASKKLNDKWELSAGVKWFHDANPGAQVSAHLRTEATPFTVMNDGLGKNQVNLSAGLRYAVGESESLQLRGSTFGSKGHQLAVGYSKRF